MIWSLGDSVPIQCFKEGCATLCLEDDEDAGWELMTSLLDPDREKRMSAVEAKTHRFFGGVCESLP